MAARGGRITGAWRLMHHMREESATPDHLAAMIAARQHGVVTAAQLAALGIRRGGRARRIEAGRLHPVHRGVYAVGHPGLSSEGRWMAAVLACGEGAVLSHAAAAALWGMLPPPPGAVEVTVPGDGGRRRQAGIRLHRSRTLVRELTTRRQNIPATVPARTIADLRRVAPASELRRAIREAGVLGLAVGAEVHADPTRSELERRFLRLCRRHRLPAPEVNARVASFTVDFLWPKRRLIVETDGYRYHRSRLAFEEDRARDVELRLLGYEVIRFTHRQLTQDDAGVAAALRALLRSRG
jgi:very-short-patch-repair endonuclease